MATVVCIFGFSVSDSQALPIVMQMSCEQHLCSKCIWMYSLLHCIIPLMTEKGQNCCVLIVHLYRNCAMSQTHLWNKKWKRVLSLELYANALKIGNFICIVYKVMVTWSRKSQQLYPVTVLLTLNHFSYYPKLSHGSFILNISSWVNS
jgi:hypothetical protein